jgi:hypothetical protein
MSTLRYILIFIVSLLLACRDDDKAQEVALTVISDDYLNIPAGRDVHVFISDENGTVLDSQPIPNNSTVTLRAPTDINKINITEFHVNRDGSNFYYFSTWSSIQRGMMMNLKGYPPVGPVSTAGNILLKINDYQESTQPEAALSFSIYPWIYGINSATLNENTLTVDYSIVSNPEEILVTGYRSGEPVYHFLKDVKPSDNISISYNEFAVADKTLTLPDESYGETFGYYADGSVHLTSRSSLLFYTKNNEGPYKLSYPPGFETYFTRFTKLIGNGNSVDYQKRGEPSSNVIIPEYTYTVNDESPLHFNVTIPQPYLYKRVTWYNDVLTWSVASSQTGTTRISSVPGNILAKYPDIKTNDLIYGWFDVVNHVGLTDYNEVWVKNLNDLNFSEGTFEQFIFRFDQ